ncbi:hypothetical protein M0804_008880 [Polistes exclamans]|nr:hypothetical protein M0804_008880 [Polistes exclamans]
MRSDSKKLSEEVVRRRSSKKTERCLSGRNDWYVSALRSKQWTIGAMYVCMLYAILFLKLWSYIQVNMWCRVSHGKTSSQGRMRRQSLSYNNLQCNTGYPVVARKFDPSPSGLI